MSQQSFQLGSAEVGGRARAVVRTDTAVVALDDLTGSAAPAELRPLFDDWDGWVERIGARLAEGIDGLPALDTAQLRWLAPLRHPGKLVCIGQNYREHNAEMERASGGVDRAADRPRFPYSFMAPTRNAIVGDGVEVALPSFASKFDWEAEVAIVIGRRTRDARGAQAQAAIGAYTILNDLSARDWTHPNAPRIGVDWVMQKAYDGFKPMGPLVLPAAFVADSGDIGVRAWVNGEQKQDGNTRDMIFSFAEIVEHLSAIMTLEPGDVIATGTPAGVGHGRDPKEYLSSGDVIAVEVDGMGRLETTLR